MKRWFRDVRLNKENRKRLDVINSIIDEYKSEGYTLTLRQLYYQLVSRDIIPNKDSEYDKVSRLLKEGRMAGIVDWDAIEDRLRQPYIPYSNTSPSQAIRDAERYYRLDRQEGQDTYIEVWVEKDALSGVLKRVTEKYHVRLLVNRGYGSVTAIHDAYERFASQIRKNKSCVILYLGDHDPSGMDMIRDIQERIDEMLESDGYINHLYVNPIALTMEQIKRYQPPENPAKLTDPRAKDYILEFGSVSWEVDALNPKTLHKLLSDRIEENMDMEKYREIMEREVRDREKLKKIADKYSNK